MTVWESMLLGFIQGATEFLPVSSSGHLVMAQAVLAIEIPGVTFEVAVHLATLVSILLVYRSRVAGLAAGALRLDADALRYIGAIVVATIPAGLLGVLAEDRIEALFDNPFAPGVALLVTGAVLWSSRVPLGRAGAAEAVVPADHASGDGAPADAAPAILAPTWTVALLIGVAQAFALVPGISRSGATVVAALWLGLEAREAAAFSFLMAVPAIGGAAVLMIPEFGSAAGMGLATGTIVAGSVVAGVTGVLAIRTFVAMLARRSFHFFAPYCWTVAVAYLLFLTLR